MLQPGRKHSVGSGYRYGFNGKENDNEVKGEGNQQDYGMRIYDGRIGRFLSVDPLVKHYPFYSSYHYASNNPIVNIDLDGLEGKSKTTYADLNPVEKFFFMMIDMQERIGRISTEVVPTNMAEYEQNIQQGQNTILFWLSFGEFTLNTIKIPEARPSPINSSTVKAEARYTTTLAVPTAPNALKTTLVKSEAAGLKSATATGLKDEVTTTTSGVVPQKLQVGTYKAMTKANAKTGKSSDHIPSFAAVKAHKETILNRKLTLSELKELKQSTLTIVYETKIHETTSRTFGGRNSPSQIIKDAADLLVAIQNDINALTPKLIKEGYQLDDIKAAQEILKSKYLPKSN